MDDRQDGCRGDEGTATVDQVSPPDPATENQPSEQTARRREALALHLEQLEETQRSGADLQVALAGTDLDAWELAQLDQGPGGVSHRWHDLIAEGVAFRNKCQTDVGWSSDERQLSVEELNDFRDILITDASLGVALLEETQRAVNQLIRSGEMDVVKKLTGFRNKIARSVNELKGIIGVKGYAEAAAIAEELITPEGQASWTGRRTPPPTPTKRTPKPVRRVAFEASQVVFKEEKGARESNLKPLLMLLGLSVVVWGVFILPKLTVKTVQMLTVNDISPKSEIRHVVAKPPSLFVELDSHGWRALSGQERLALVDDVGRTAAAAGYNGVHFKLESGKTAAQWLKEHGSRLID